MAKPDLHVLHVSTGFNQNRGVGVPQGMIIKGKQQLLVDYPGTILERIRGSVFAVFRYANHAEEGMLAHSICELKLAAGINDAENDVKLGISWVQKLLTYGIMTVSRTKQDNAVREFGTYEYDKDSIKKGKEEPVKIDDHCMDGIRYLVMGLWSKIKRWLPVPGDDEGKNNGYFFVFQEL